MSDAPPRSSASVRRRLTAATAVISSVGMLTLIVVVLLVAWRTTDHEIDQVLATRIAAVRSAADVVDGRPTAADPEDPTFADSGWVADERGTVIAGPSVSAPLTRAVDRLARAGTGVTEVGPWRVQAVPLRAGRQVGTAIAAVDTGPYRSGLGRLVVASVVTGVVVVGGVTVLAGLIVRRALAPVGVMTATALEWSHERPDRRFALGPPRDEITGLAAVLDGLLDRVDRAIRAEQRLTAEVAHELRTPLTVVRGEAELGAATPRLRRADRERFERIVAAADDMGAAMTTVLDAARGSGSTATADVDAVLAAQAARPGLALPVVVDDGAPHLVAAAPAEVLGRALAPLVDNAARHGRTAVRLKAEQRDGRVVVAVTDDGDGVAAEVGDVFEPGVRDASSDGAGLGLALARRLARSVGGDARLVSRTPAVFAIDVPAARDGT
jgi:two-component system, OmpR family, sensor kinase